MFDLTKLNLLPYFSNLAPPGHIQNKKKDIFRKIFIIVTT